MASSARMSLAACLLLATVALGHARVLHQTANPDFSYQEATYISSVTPIQAGVTAASADACITLCSDDANCEFWSWCPATATTGCIVPGINGGVDTTVAASGCVLSYDSTTDRSAIYAVSGTSVTFVGGRYSPSNPGADPAAPVDPNNPAAAWIDPAGIPAECNGWFSGDQWSGDEVECHVCEKSIQLKCDLDTDLIGDDSVKCEVDNAGLGALVNNAIEFECTVDFNKIPQNQCDWAAMEAQLPGCALEPVRRIMATWRPDE